MGRVDEQNGGDDRSNGTAEDDPEVGIEAGRRVLGGDTSDVMFEYGNGHFGPRC